MKKMFFLALLVITACAISNAQDSSSNRKPRPAKDSVHRVNPMKQIGLTKDQQDKVTAADKDFRTNTKEVKSDSTLTADQKKAKLKELRQEHENAIDGILTADQKAKLKEIKAGDKANSPQKGNPSPKTP